MKNTYNNNEIIRCSNCGEPITNWNSVCYANDDDNEEYPFCCEECLGEGTTECIFCSDRLLNPLYTENDTYGENPMCQYHYDNETYECTCCHHHFIDSDDTEATYTSTDWYNDHPVCPSCAEEELCRCESCGDTIWRDNSYYNSLYDCLCGCCYDNMEYGDIHEYEYSPDLNFNGTGPRFFGVELEVDEGGKDCSIASEVINIADDDVYCKEDSSLSCGFEIVSHPCSLDYHKNNLKWKSIMDYLKHNEYRSHDTDTCGLHVHISRDAFGESAEEKENTINKIILFLEKNREYVTRFSRRTPEKLRHWAAFYMDEGDEISVEEIKKRKDNRRYHTVNLLNYDTVEFRLFRGTLKYNTFIATLEFLDLLLDTALQMTESEIDNLNFEDFVELIPDDGSYSELIQYLKERGLM